MIRSLFFFFIDRWWTLPGTLNWQDKAGRNLLKTVPFDRVVALDGRTGER
jgi:hypothetical protein